MDEVPYNRKMLAGRTWLSTACSRRSALKDFTMTSTAFNVDLQRGASCAADTPDDRYGGEPSVGQPTLRGHELNSVHARHREVQQDERRAVQPQRLESIGASQAVCAGQP
jgi:hypothetical protein